MDETLMGPEPATVKTAGQTLSWKSKFKHFDLQQQQRPLRLLICWGTEETTSQIS